MLAAPAGAMPSTASFVQPVVPAFSDADETPPSHLSLMSNQDSAIWDAPVAAVPLAHTSPCHFWPGCTGAIGATRNDGAPESSLPVRVKLIDHLPECAAEVVFTAVPRSGRYGL